MKTLAAILTKQNAPLELMELTIPPLKEGQVLVDIVYTGICRTQLNEIQGKKGEDPYIPHALGHEASGIVAAVGPKVEKVSEGDSVIATWIRGQGLNCPSATYQAGDLTINSGGIATFMQRAVISENRLVRLPSSFPLREASLFGCAIPTGAGIVFNQLKDVKEKTVGIFGLGGIGLSVLLAARILSPKNLVAIDVKEEKLQMAKKLGATHTIKADSNTFVDQLMEITDGQGMDFSVEAAGHHSAMEHAFQLVRKNGGLCVLAGNIPKGTHIRFDPFGLIEGKRISGSWGGNVDPDRDIPLYLEKFKDHLDDLNQLITHEFPLEKINEGIELMDGGQAGRILIRCQ